VLDIHSGGTGGWRSRCQSRKNGAGEGESTEREEAHSEETVENLVPLGACVHLYLAGRNGYSERLP